MFIFIKSLNKSIFQPYDKNTVVVRAEEWMDEEYKYEYVELSNGVKQVERISVDRLLF